MLTVSNVTRALLPACHSSWYGRAKGQNGTSGKALVRLRVGHLVWNKFLSSANLCIRYQSLSDRTASRMVIALRLAVISRCVRVCEALSWECVGKVSVEWLLGRRVWSDGRRTHES